jgi:hypothetical protein
VHFYFRAQLDCLNQTLFYEPGFCFISLPKLAIDLVSFRALQNDFDFYLLLILVDVLA